MFEITYPERLMSDLLKIPELETIIKSKNLSLTTYILKKYYTKWFKYWNSIKVALRHNYHFNDPKMWFEQIELLIKYKQDILNPKNICPKNLIEAHQVYIDKEEKRRELERAEMQRLNRLHEIAEKKRRIKRRKNNLKLFKSHVKKYEKLIFKNGKITISILRTIKDYDYEARELKHCVNGSNYYFNFDSLIFSSKINGKRIETTEVDLRYYQIEQSRGFKNAPSKYHLRIIKTIEDNMDLIKRTKETKVKKKRKTNKLKEVA